ncbi:sugar phosphate isomerase/epimerase [Salinisphaera sp. Q1T1-3]|uniref:sugar phosphate isomerase/epimerase family protein n=1 Tax=Salinisphaera sp. Q1T1-3 TaxID=2321229 RepID=UPI000E711B78|nr:TIM barrel protein [Salinisphaera sp. Q1T1-3]RJS91867.1 sugar phosphate isomerase/epimerase [Salinisphaera sp. Q1T1-3]
MKIGLSTYAFTWRKSSSMPVPMTLADMLQETATLGGTVFQICDHPAIEDFSARDLDTLRRQAEALGITLELGTRGLAPAKLARYLDIAEALDVALLRSMFNDADSQPTAGQAEQQLREILPRLQHQGVTLALETYEQVAIDTLMATVEAIDDAHIGVCLDPGNCVAALEMPERVIARTVERVANLHIKDFCFTRADGWVGFRLLGCPLGDGLLPLGTMLERVAPAARGINLIVEHWLDWQTDAQRTAAVEAEWTRHSMHILRSIES